VEAVVDEVAAKASELFKGRFPEVGKCQCTQHACGNDFDASDKCHKELGGASICEDCPGQKLDFTKSFILTPPLTALENLGDSMKDSICTFRGIDDVFANATDEFGVRAWTYVATTNGVMRAWPGHAMERGEDVPAGEGEEGLGNCQSYDPRLRPWYVAATSGPKDVVMVIDTSGSMLTADGELFGDFRSRWEITKEALLALLGTFGISDYINLVEFNDEVKVLATGKLLQAKEDEIALLRDEVENIEPLGGTDFRLGLEAAFDLLINATTRSIEDEEPTSSRCQKVILFLTDGEDCTISDAKCSMPVLANETGVDSVLQFIEKKQSELEALGSQRAHLFTFSFGLEADDEIPKEMACAHQGVWNRILSEDDPLVALNAYTSYLASRRGDANVIWSRTYDDAFGLGTVVTAAKPIYGPTTSKGEQGGLIGVVGHDVRIEDFNERAPGFQVVISRFISRGVQCIPIEFSGCELQLLRGEDAQCPEIFDDSKCYFFEETGDYYMAPKTPLLNFAEAKAFCEDQGGFLAEIDEELEENLMSGIAANSGSWVGLTFNNSEWKWLQSGRVEDARSDVWTVLSNPSGRGGEACAVIDRRGVIKNVHPKNCQEKTHFICEFVGPGLPAGCKEEDTIRVDGDYEYNVRPLSTCRPEEESLRDATAISPAAKGLTNKQVICPLGEAKSTFEVRCCKDCKL